MSAISEPVGGTSVPDEVALELGPLKIKAWGSLARQALYLGSFVLLTCSGVYLGETRIISRLDKLDAEVREIKIEVDHSVQGQSVGRIPVKHPHQVLAQFP